MLFVAIPRRADSQDLAGARNRSTVNLPELLRLTVPQSANMNIPQLKKVKDLALRIVLPSFFTRDSSLI
jgi:hypothetical protein